MTCVAHSVRVLRFVLVYACACSATLSARHTSLVSELDSLRSQHCSLSTSLRTEREREVSKRADLSDALGRERVLEASNEQLSTEINVKHDEYVAKQTEQTNNRQCMQVHVNERSKMQAELAQANQQVQQLETQKNKVSTEQKKAVQLFEELQVPLGKGRRIAELQQKQQQQQQTKVTGLLQHSAARR